MTAVQRFARQPRKGAPGGQRVPGEENRQWTTDISMN